MGSIGDVSVGLGPFGYGYFSVNFCRSTGNFWERYDRHAGRVYRTAREAAANRRRDDVQELDCCLLGHMIAPIKKRLEIAD